MQIQYKMYVQKPDCAKISMFEVNFTKLNVLSMLIQKIKVLRKYSTKPSTCTSKSCGNGY